jgi:phosphatidylglycerol:prolipoprotein diacylglycerol transferase
MWMFARRNGRTFFEITDFIVPMVPLGLAFGRLGNFINQELWGRATDVSWAMVFPADSLGLARHPSQLYHFALEGVLLFLILLFFNSSPRPRYAASGLFLLGYGIFRFFTEFFREPDAHIGFDLFEWMTRGQLLCIPMLVAGMILLLLAYRKKPAGNTA